MSWNDDFDFDDYDDLGDQGDDFPEDMFNESELNTDDPIVKELDDPAAFDFQDVFIFGGMIVGQAYEETQDEKDQHKIEGNTDKS